MQMKIPIELPNGAHATATIKLSMSQEQKIYAMNVLGLSAEEIENMLGQEFQQYAVLLGADDSQQP